MSLTYDLSTNSKWSTLAGGTHNVTIIAKADGYENSDPSTAVTFTKQGGYKFKHFVDKGLQGSGTIKFRHYGAESNVTLITFTVDGTQYQAEEGMTWQEFLDSSYNVDGWYASGSTVMKNNASYIVEGTSSESIIAGKAYVSTGICFVAGTPIPMSDKTYKPIEAVVIGDEVVTYNEEQGIYRTCKVVNTFIRQKDIIVTMTLEDDSVLQFTENHPFYTNNGWKSLNNYKGYPTLTLQDKLLTINGQWIAIKSIVKTTLQEPINVYNLNIEPDDNYFAGTTPVMAHNDDYSEYE